MERHRENQVGRCKVGHHRRLGCQGGHGGKTCHAMAEFPLQNQSNQGRLIIKRGSGQHKRLFTGETVATEMILSRWKGQTATAAEGRNNWNKSGTAGIAEKREPIPVKRPVAAQATGRKKKILYACRKRHSRLVVVVYGSRHGPRPTGSGDQGTDIGAGLSLHRCTDCIFHGFKA